MIRAWMGPRLESDDDDDGGGNDDNNEVFIMKQVSVPWT